MTKIIGIHDKEAVSAMEAHVISECTAINQEAVFDDMLDECYSFKDVGGPFAHMAPSRVLKECAPVDYRCGVADYFGTSDDNYEVGSELYYKRDVDEAAEEFIDGLRSELADLESELEELQADEDKDANAIEAKQDEIARKESAIEACENHAW